MATRTKTKTEPVAEPPVKMRAAVGDFTIHLGALTMRGKLVSVQAPESKGKGDGSYHLCTPQKKPVKMAFVDDEGNVFAKDDLLYYREENGKIVVVNKDAVAAAKESQLPKNVMYLNVHPAADDSFFSPMGTRQSLAFIPADSDPHNTACNEVILNLLEEGYVLAAVCNVNNHDCLYRLIIWRGHVVLQPQAFPAALNPHREPPRVQLPEAVISKAQELAQVLASDYDPAEYSDARLERIRNAEAIKAGRRTGAQIVAKAKEIDIAGLLDMAISSQK